ncbi:MAG: hypothetical protein QXV17_10975 [Candidatus Micrarchaeaceae archaeon]
MIANTVQTSKYRINKEYRVKLRDAIMSSFMKLNLIVRDELTDHNPYYKDDVTEVHSSLKQGLINVVLKLNKESYHVISVYYSLQTSKAITPSDVKRDLLKAKEWLQRFPFLKNPGKASYTFVYIADRITLSAEKYLKEAFRRMDWFDDGSGNKRGVGKDGILVLRLRRNRELIPINEVKEILVKDFLSRISKSMSQILGKRLFNLIGRLVYKKENHPAEESVNMIKNIKKILTGIDDKIDVGAKKTVIKHLLTVANDFLKDGIKAAESHNYRELLKYFGYQNPGYSKDNKLKGIRYEKERNPVTPDMGTITKKRVINPNTGSIVDDVPEDEVNSVNDESTNYAKDNGIVEEDIPDVDDIRDA